MACRRVVQQCVVLGESVGYARASTAEQTAALQQDALRAAGCRRIWSDTTSGTRTDRPQLAALFDHLRVGDTLVVWRLDRLGRSLPHLIETIGELQARGVGFKSVQEHIDTTTPGGRLVFHVFGALASFERELIQERTLAGLAAARERGRFGGRPSVLSPAKLRQARRMIGEKTPVTEVAQVLGVSRATLYRRVPELAEARTRPVMNEPDAGVTQEADRRRAGLSVTPAAIVAFKAIVDCRSLPRAQGELRARVGPACDGAQSSRPDDGARPAGTTLRHARMRGESIRGPPSPH